MFSKLIRKNYYKRISDSVSIDKKALVKKRINFNESDAKPPTPMEIIWLFF
ncbi:sugar ABC transporter permease, partial [Mycoplasmopsis pullorum]